MSKNISRRRSFLVLLAALAPGAASFFPPHAEAESKTEIMIDNFVFAPETLAVAAGTTVSWTNRDDIPHTVVEKNGLFHSKALDTNDSFAFTFNKAGNYDYFCGLHPHMTGKIAVKA